MQAVRYVSGFIFVLLTALLFSSESWASDKPVWVSQSETGESQVHLYFFWSKKCPHCLEALPFIKSMAQNNAWIKLHDLELTEHPAHVKKYSEMAAELGEEARSVPAFFWCGSMVTGYDDEQGMGQFLLDELTRCGENAGSVSTAPVVPVRIPFIGEVSAERFSLPVYTVILAGMDAFNPCAFFVLLFLLSLLVNAKSRARIMLVGGIFIFSQACCIFCSCLRG